MWNSDDLPDGFELPEGISPEDIADIYKIEKPGDIDKLPGEVAKALTKAIMGEHAKLLMTSRITMMVLARLLIRLYAIAVTHNPKSAATIELKGALDIMGDYLDLNGMVPKTDFDGLVKTGVDVLTGKLKPDDVDAALAKLTENIAEGTIETTHVVEASANDPDVDRARKLAEAFSRLNPNSNRARGVNDPF